MPGFPGCSQLPRKPHGSCMSGRSMGFSPCIQATFPFWRSIFLLSLRGEPHGWSHITSRDRSIWFLCSFTGLLFQAKGIWSPRSSSAHISRTPQSHLFCDWMLHHPLRSIWWTVSTVPPTGDFSISQGFGQLGWHLRWQISGGLAPSHSFSRH